MSNDQKEKMDLSFNVFPSDAATQPAAFVDPFHKKPERAVLVTTEFRGVFFGYATDTDGETVKLKRARNCIYWPAENKGFLGLASMGPVDGARVGPPADIELRRVTCVAEVTSEAAARWEAFKW